VADTLAGVRERLIAPPATSTATTFGSVSRATFTTLRAGNRMALATSKTCAEQNSIC
jgi:hypothetical protein